MRSFVLTVQRSSTRNPLLNALGPTIRSLGYVRFNLNQLRNFMPAPSQDFRREVFLSRRRRPLWNQLNTALKCLKEGTKSYAMLQQPRLDLQQGLLVCFCIV